MYDGNKFDAIARRRHCPTHIALPTLPTMQRCSPYPQCSGAHPPVLRQQSLQLQLDVVAHQGGAERRRAQRCRRRPRGGATGAADGADRVARHRLPARLVGEIEAAQLNDVRRLRRRKRRKFPKYVEPSLNGILRCRMTSLGRFGL